MEKPILYVNENDEIVIKNVPKTYDGQIELIFYKGTLSITKHNGNRTLLPNHSVISVKNEDGVIHIRSEEIAEYVRNEFRSNIVYFLKMADQLFSSPMCNSL